MSLDKKTISLQQELANYCRDGKAVELEGAKNDKLHHYRRLVYNVTYGIIEKAFPILKSILDEPQFKSLINEYMTQHNSQTPQVWKLPGEFYEFVITRPMKVFDSFPFLPDLMLMEWMEILVYNRENQKTKAFQQDLNYEDSLVLNPDTEILALEYPVFRGDWDKMEELKSDYILLISRNPETFKVHFMEISRLHRLIIDQLEQGQNVTEIINSISGESTLEEKAQIGTALKSFIDDLFEKRIVLGITSKS